VDVAQGFFLGAAYIFCGYPWGAAADFAATQRRNRGEGAAAMCNFSVNAGTHFPTLHERSKNAHAFQKKNNADNSY
jgi:hypothetical protein